MPDDGPSFEALQAHAKILHNILREIEGEHEVWSSSTSLYDHIHSQISMSSRHCANSEELYYFYSFLQRFAIEEVVNMLGYEVVTMYVPQDHELWKSDLALYGPFKPSASSFETDGLRLVFKYPSRPDLPATRDVYILRRSADSRIIGPFEFGVFACQKDAWEQFRKEVDEYAIMNRTCQSKKELESPITDSQEMHLPLMVVCPGRLMYPCGYESIETHGGFKLVRNNYWYLANGATTMKEVDELRAADVEVKGMIEEVEEMTI